MTKHSLFRYFKISLKVIRLAVMLYVRFPLSLRIIEDLLHESRINVSHQTVRYWWNRFDLMLTADIRKKRVQQMWILQKFAAVHSSVYNHFNQESHLNSRANFKPNRAAALAEWQFIFAS